MEKQPPDNFDDAALKSAVRRAWGDERAPDSLRKSIALMAVPKPTAPAPRSSWSRFLGPSPIKSLAAAVLLSIGVAALAYQAYRMTRPIHANTIEKIPVSVAHQLAADHDQLVAGSEKWNPDLPHDNADRLAAALKQKLKYVPMTASPGDGFSLVGATMVGKGSGAELLYQKGKETVSVFSLPASAVPLCQNNATVSGAGLPNHPMAGFVHDGGFYMLVGSSTDNSMSGADVKTLRDKLRSTIPGAACPAQ